MAARAREQRGYQHDIDMLGLEADRRIEELKMRLEAGAGSPRGQYYRGLPVPIWSALINSASGESELRGNFPAILNRNVRSLPYMGNAPGWGVRAYPSPTSGSGEQLFNAGGANVNQTVKAFNDIVADMQANGVGEIDWNAAAQYYPGADMNEVKSKVEAWLNSQQ